MTLVHIAGVTLDVCVPCRAVWFDRGELGIIAMHHKAKLDEHLSEKRSASGQIASAVLDGAANADLVVLSMDAAHTAGNLAVNGVAGALDGGTGTEIVASAGEVALEAASSVGEFAAATAGGILEILADIF